MNPRTVTLLTLAMAASFSTARGQKPAAPAAPTAGALMALNRPLVIAHRGYSEAAPENTLPAFQLAKLAAADLIELDYYHSADGQPIVIHDTTLDRTTDAVARWGGKKLPVASRPAAELLSLDAGAWFSPQFGGTKLPTLGEALDCIQDGSVTLIERKAGDAATCAALLKSRQLINKVIVQAFDWQYLADFHRIEPAQILGALGPNPALDGRKVAKEEKLLSAAWAESAARAGASVIGWNEQVDQAGIAAAHAKGLKVWIYTINDAAKASALLALGVDGIITNNPPLIWRTMALRGK